MKRQTKIQVAISLIILLTSMSVYAQEEVERAKAPFRPAEPPRLYVAPTADIIPSLDLSLAASGGFGATGASFRGVAGFGLADIAQIEVHTMSVINNDREENKLTNMYAPGFKMMLLREGKWSYGWLSSPGLAWSLRSSVWTEDQEKKMTYKTKMADLYFVATERLGPLGIHAGVDIFDARLKTDVMEGQGLEEVKKNFVRPFGGLDLWVTERGKAMAELGWTANFDYAEDGIQKDDNIDPIWVALLGVRFFVTRYTTLDVGVRYQKDYEGVSDASIEAKIDTFIPTHLLYRYARGEK